MVYIGVDVGVAGGIVALDEGGYVILAVKMPRTDSDLLSVLKFHNAVAVLERVSSSPQMGVKSAFTFGGGYRACKLALLANKIPYVEVSPQKWQRAMKCLTGGDKQVTKVMAEHLFPKTRVTHAIADALLIAEYCRLYKDVIFHEK